MTDQVKREVAVPTACCPTPTLWKCYDSEGTELEVLAGIRALVVMLKPNVLLETGCYRGYGTEQLARGIYENGFGHLHTTDTGHDMVLITKERLWERSLYSVVTLHHQSGLDLIAEMTEPVDFAFLDSGADDMRCQELRALLPKLSKSAVVAVHDTGLQHGLREPFIQTVQELGLMSFMFDTPRGLSLVRKPWR
jgi:predicted O-methyltransferase YrrM